MTNVTSMSACVFFVYFSFSPLHHAALNGNLELITLLLESQASVDIRDQKGEGRMGTAMGAHTHAHTHKSTEFKGCEVEEEKLEKCGGQ